MKLRTIQTTILTACLCACMIAFTGCSGRTGRQPGTSAGDSSTESIGEYSAESSETSSDDMPPESSSVPQTSSYEDYQEFIVDQQLLDSLNQEILEVKIFLNVDYEALSAEFDEKYSDLEGDYYYNRGCFLANRCDQVRMELERDYDIKYKENNRTGIGLIAFYCELDKETIPLMLNDSRVKQIRYWVGYNPPIKNF